LCDAEFARRYERQAPMPFNLTGCPALVIPAGFTRGQHLPLSVQIVGHPFEEAVVYGVAQVYEDASGWVNQHPPLD
jgi:Asp-tRNA(Asn)/Glu-tRNA(Gln) amidotransferase A subunit family amidase